MFTVIRAFINRLKSLYRPLGLSCPNNKVNADSRIRGNDLPRALLRSKENAFYGTLSLILLLPFTSGCAIFRHENNVDLIKPISTPRELCKTTMPIYRIEPPDILTVEIVRTVPKADYRLNTTDLVKIHVSRNSIDKLVAGDVLSIRVPGTPAISPIDGNFVVQSDGTISLGTPYETVAVAQLSLPEARQAIQTSLSKQLIAADTYVALAQASTPIENEYPIEIDGNVDFGHPYGSIRLADLTLNQAREELTKHFSKVLGESSVSLNLLQSSAVQQVAGEHLVGPDGYVTLGIYGSVKVVGLTLEEANTAIETALSENLDKPRVATSVLSYNSKLYYIITQGAGIGDAVYRYPITGNETVLDALSLIQGIPQGSSSRMWISRPSDCESRYQILPIQWEELSALAETNTNYQLMPGDRLYIERDPLITFDTYIAKLTNPLERVLGFSLLGTGTTTRLSGKVLNGGGNKNSQF